MLPKKGIVFPNEENLGPYAEAIAYALRNELGTTHRAIKTVMRWTGAGERTVKNWFAGISGPNGRHLVALMRHSDCVFEVLLLLSGRQQIKIAKTLADTRNKVVEMLREIDLLMGLERAL